MNRVRHPQGFSALAPAARIFDFACLSSKVTTCTAAGCAEARQSQQHGRIAFAPDHASRRMGAARGSRNGGLAARCWAVGLGLMLSLTCHADGAALAKVGNGETAACQTCHGSAGEGNAQAGFPRLAGLGSAYMARQLAAFADGTRVSPVMTPIAKALSVDQQAEVSSYYAALPVHATPSAAVPTARASPPAAMAEGALVGTILATRGRWADTLPACDQCHGPAGSGVGPDFPALAGQSASYLASQLSAWQTGARPPGPMGLMAVIAKKLSATDVRAVADHYAAIPAGAAR